MSTLILKSLQIHREIIEECGITLPKAIAVSCGTNNMKKIIEHLTIFKCRLNSSESSKEKIFEAMAQGGDMVIFPLTSPKAPYRHIDYGLTLSTQGYFNQKKIRAIPILLCSCPIPEQFLSEVLTLRMECETVASCIELRDVVPLPEEIDCIKEAISKIADNETEYGKPLQAAVACLYPGLHRAGLETEYEALRREAIRIASLHENNVASDDLVEVVIEHLYELQRTGRLPQVKYLKEITEEDMNQKDRCIFYDSRFAYVSEKCFRNLVADLLSYFDIDVIRRELADADIIIREAKSTRYVSKMNAKINGNLWRPSMLRISRDNWCLPGQLEIIELCLNSN